MFYRSNVFKEFGHVRRVAEKRECFSGIPKIKQACTHVSGAVFFNMTHSPHVFLSFHSFVLINNLHQIKLRPNSFHNFCLRSIPLCRSFSLGPYCSLVVHWILCSSHSNITKMFCKFTSYCCFHGSLQNKQNYVSEGMPHHT